MTLRGRLVLFSLSALIVATACAAPEREIGRGVQTVGAECDGATPAFTSAFRGLTSGRRAVPICVADVGPGLADPALAARFRTVTAGNVRNAERMTGTDLDLLGVLVGTLESGTGEEFVAELMSRLGPGAAHGTLEIEHRRMQFIDLRPNGPRGYAYGMGDQVVIAYARSPLGPPSHPLMEYELQEAVADVLDPLGPAPTDTASPTGDEIDDWPMAKGDFSSPADPGWVYFRTDGDGVVEIHCGMRPDGGLVGCDLGFTPFAAPEGTNQIILDEAGVRYAHSDEPTFTRPGVGIAWIGERLVNGPASCTITSQAPMFCRVVDADGRPHRALFK